MPHHTLKMRRRMQSHHILKENRFFEHIGGTAPPPQKNRQDILVYSYEIELNSFLPVFCPGNQSKKKKKKK